MVSNSTSTYTSKHKHKRILLLQLSITVHDEILGLPACHKNFKSLEEAMQYLKDVNEINGVRGVLKVKGVAKDASL